MPRRLLRCPSLSLLLALLLGGAASLPACARTGLRGAERCFEEGATLACEGPCGEGVTTCSAGYWSSCDVPRVEVACENACGVGIQVCEDEVLSACVVPDVSVACENLCGVGTQTCSGGLWQDCVVPPAVLPCSTKCGSGELLCENGVTGPCSAPQPLPPVLSATVRDFRESHPDFEIDTPGDDRGIVLPLLGPDGKPVYAHGTTGSLTTSNQTNFDQWYRDVPGVNLTTTIELPLQVSAVDQRRYVYQSAAFFPIDGELFGNEGHPHNYHFTLEASGTFIYQGGEVFSFTGDDDVFVFVNGRLVIDLGGLHESESASVALDDVAPNIGMVLGGTYGLVIFFAERHTVASNFNIDTSIAGLGECP